MLATLDVTESIIYLRGPREGIFLHREAKLMSLLPDSSPDEGRSIKEVCAISLA